ncbi:MAG: hypothetical protein C0407_04965 [Desulfobacca sp.]|nr:hypothetical protein [Desulfobacca sp.]
MILSTKFGPVGKNSRGEILGLPSDGLELLTEPGSSIWSLTFGEVTFLGPVFTMKWKKLQKGIYLIIQARKRHNPPLWVEILKPFHSLAYQIGYLYSSGRSQGPAALIGNNLFFQFQALIMKALPHCSDPALLPTLFILAVKNPSRIKSVPCPAFIRLGKKLQVN